MSEPATPLGEVYATAYEKYASRPAARDARREITYSELGSRVRRLVNAMRSRGVEPGSRVVLLGSNSCQYVEADHATAIGGYARAGLLPRLHVAELTQIAEDAEPDIVMVDGRWLAEHGRDWVPAGVKEIVVMGDAKVAGLVGFDEFLESGADEELPTPDPEALAWLQYTSGSTGLPKGVMVTHRTIGALIRNALDAMPEIRPGDVALHTAPISHFSGGILKAVEAGGGLNILEPAFDAGHVIDVAQAGEVTILPLVPTMITMVVEELARRGPPEGRVGNVKLVPYAGSAIQPDRAAAARRYFGDAMQQLYGASEAQMPITSLRPQDHVEDTNERGLPRLASAGKPSRYVEVAIVDESRRPLPAGEAGEIRTRGEHASLGYWRQPEATAETFQDGWVYTGDVGYIDEDGYLFILDRRKDMIITGGFNVYPREVENVISTLRGVREVAVVGAPDPKWGELITAVISTEPGASLTADDVIAHCRASLGGYKVPKRVDFIDELPKSGAGKILKPVIKEQLWADHARRV